MKALLITYGKEEVIQVDEVEIDPKHDFSNGPHQDTIPFSVASNQDIVPIGRKDIF